MWNSYHIDIVSNALLLNLPIHSIHHLVPKRPFPVHNAFFHTQLAHDAAVPLQIARARRRFLYTRSRDALQQPLAQGACVQRRLLQLHRDSRDRAQRRSRYAHSRRSTPN